MSSENKYKEGETVYALVAPSVVLVVRRYIRDIYYCRLKTDPEAKELVYFERELGRSNESDKAGNGQHNFTA